MSSSQKFTLAVFALFILIFSFYFPALHFDFVGFDDGALVIQNGDIKSLAPNYLGRLLSHFYETLYIPFTMLSYSVDYQVWGLNPFGFRFTNILIHFLNSILVLYFVKEISKSFAIAFSVALIFALHPVQIESVVWVSERKNVLAAFFLLLSSIFYWRSIHLENSFSLLSFFRKRGGSEANRNLIVCAFSYALGLLSKPSIVTFPFLVIAMNYFFAGNKQKWKERAWFYFFIFLSSAVISLVTVWGTKTSVETYGFLGNSYWASFFVMLTVFWRYIKLLFFPASQNILYSSFAYRSFFDPVVFCSAVGIVFLIVLIFIFRKKEKEICFWSCWYFILFLPMSNIFAPFPSIMNDRYLYLPIIGFFTALILLLKRFTKGFLFQSASKTAQLTSLGLVFCFLLPTTLISVKRLPDWQNADHLWSAAFQRSNGRDPGIYYFAGIEKIKSGDYKKAVEWLEKSHFMRPTRNSLLALGTACVAVGKYEKAEKYLKNVIELDPKSSGAYDQLGVIYRKTGRLEESKQAFLKALALEPSNPVFYNNYGLLLVDFGKSEEARDAWEYSLEIDPDFSFALRNLSFYYFDKGEVKRAAFYLQRYSRLYAGDKELRELARKVLLQLENG